MGDDQHSLRIFGTILDGRLRRCVTSQLGRELRSMEESMRVMVIVKANKDSEEGKTPDEKLLSEMGKFQ